MDDDVERALDTGEHIDDDVVLPKGLMSSGIGGEGGADATETDMDADATPFDLCSFSASKAELLPAIERQLEVHSGLVAWMQEPRTLRTWRDACVPCRQWM